MPSTHLVLPNLVVAETVTLSDPNLRCGRSHVSFPIAVLAGLVALTAVVAWGFWLGVDWDQLTWLGGILLAFLAVMASAVLVSVWQEREQSEPYQISFDGDRVRFQRGQLWIHAPIREMKWFEGKTNQASATRELPLRNKCQILLFPTGFSVACGLTSETRDRWRHVFDESECQHLVNLEGFQGILLGLLQITMTVAGGFFGYQFGRWIEQAIAAINWFPAFPGSVAPSICIAGIWLGFVILPLTVTGWRRGTADERDRWLRATFFIPCKFGVPLLMGPPPAGMTVIVSVITVTSLIAMTYVLFCRGQKLAERGCETNFDDSFSMSRSKNSSANEKG